jgi:hypothetical protein
MGGNPTLAQHGHGHVGTPPTRRSAVSIAANPLGAVLSSSGTTTRNRQPGEPGAEQHPRRAGHLGADSVASPDRPTLRVRVLRIPADTVSNSYGSEAEDRRPLTAPRKAQFPEATTGEYRSWRNTRLTSTDVSGRCVRCWTLAAVPGGMGWK